MRHTLLFGSEFGRQGTDNFRNTGYFNGTATSMLVPYASPVTAVPVSYRQSATDADNHLRATVAAAFAQDRIDVTRRLQVLAGVRVDSFRLEYHNNRTGETLGRTDGLVSPRLGAVVKPIEPLSLVLI